MAFFIIRADARSSGGDMKSPSPSVVVALLVFSIILIVSFLIMPLPAWAGSSPSAEAVLPELQSHSAQGAWDEFWAAFKKWFEQLAEVFAQMPLLGPVLAEVLKFIGASNVWFCGAVIFVLVLLGVYAVRR
jgi:hypothetical protein